MKQFKDLEFEPNDLGGVGAHHTFENGVTISVQASKFNYCTPRENLPSHSLYASFEVALWDDNGWLTRNYFPNINDDVLPMQGREDIDELINKLNK